MHTEWITAKVAFPDLANDIEFPALVMPGEPMTDRDLRAVRLGRDEVQRLASISSASAAETTTPGPWLELRGGRAELRRREGRTEAVLHTAHRDGGTFVLDPADDWGARLAGLRPLQYVPEVDVPADRWKYQVVDVQTLPRSGAWEAILSYDGTQVGALVSREPGYEALLIDEADERRRWTGLASLCRLNGEPVDGDVLADYLVDEYTVRREILDADRNGGHYIRGYNPIGLPERDAYLPHSAGDPIDAVRCHAATVPGGNTLRWEIWINGGWVIALDGPTPAPERAAELDRARRAHANAQTAPQGGPDVEHQHIGKNPS